MFITSGQEICCQAIESWALLREANRRLGKVRAIDVSAALGKVVDESTNAATDVE